MLSVYAKNVKNYKKTAQLIFQNAKSVLKLDKQTTKGVIYENSTIV